MQMLNIFIVGTIMQHPNKWTVIIFFEFLTSAVNLLLDLLHRHFTWPSKLLSILTPNLGYNFLLQSLQFESQQRQLCRKIPFQRQTHKMVKHTQKIRQQNGRIV